MRGKIVLVMLVLALLIAACNSIRSVESKAGEYTAPSRDADSASVTLAAVLEDLSLDPLDAENYFAAKIDYVGTMAFDAIGSGSTYDVSLKEIAESITYNGRPLSWDVEIDPSIPLDLAVTNSSGNVNLNLNDFTLTGLDVETSSGAIDAYLPAAEALYEAVLGSSSGNITATIEDSAQIKFTDLISSSGNITLNAGENAEIVSSVFTSSGNILLNFGANAQGVFTINTSSGSITVDVPDGAAVRLEVVSNSSGGVTVPAFMQRISGADEMGVWEVVGFDQAQFPITIIVNSTSSGDIRIQ